MRLLQSNGTHTDDWNLHQLLHLVASDARSNVIVQLCNYYGSIEQHDQVCCAPDKLLPCHLVPNHFVPMSDSNPYSLVRLMITIVDNGVSYSQKMLFSA